MHTQIKILELKLTLAYKFNCFCNNGSPVIGKKCDSDREFCERCEEGFDLINGVCHKICECENGTAYSEEYCDADNPIRCIKCVDGFDLVEMSCLSKFRFEWVDL